MRLRAGPSYRLLDRIVLCLFVGHVGGKLDRWPVVVCPEQDGDLDGLARIIHLVHLDVVIAIGGVCRCAAWTAS